MAGWKSRRTLAALPSRRRYRFPGSPHETVVLSHRRRSRSGSGVECRPPGSSTRAGETERAFSPTRITTAPPVPPACAAQTASGARRSRETSLGASPAGTDAIANSRGLLASRAADSVRLGLWRQPHQRPDDGVISRTAAAADSLEGDAEAPRSPIGAVGRPVRACLAVGAAKLTATTIRKHFTQGPRRYARAWRRLVFTVGWPPGPESGSPRHHYLTGMRKPHSGLWTNGA
jgi:hypothetical protein